MVKNVDRDLVVKSHILPKDGYSRMVSIFVSQKLELYFFLCIQLNWKKSTKGGLEVGGVPICQLDLQKMLNKPPKICYELFDSWCDLGGF